jgi:archaellum component FlaC
MNDIEIELRDALEQSIRETQDLRQENLQARSRLQDALEQGSDEVNARIAGIREERNNVREALEERDKEVYDLKQETTYLNRSLIGTRQEIRQTSNRNLALLKLQAEQAHNAMHSTSEAREYQIKLNKALEDIRK